jgi:hypothetical protein
MVPQEKGAKLQGIVVTNLTGIALESNGRVDRELKEISINKIK